MTEYIWGNVGIDPDVSGDQDATVWAYGNVGVPSETSSGGQEYVYGNSEQWVLQSNLVEYITGESKNYLLTTASIDAVATTTHVMGWGDVGSSGTTNLSIPYPANSSKDDLILLAAGLKRYHNTLTSSNFTRGAWTADWYKTYTVNNIVGEDTGAPRTEHQYRVLSDSVSGSETFTNGTGTSNLAAAGRMIRLKKSNAEDWAVRTYSFTENGVEADLTTIKFFLDYYNGPYRVKLSTQPIRSIGNDPDLGIVIAVGNGTWRTMDTYNWTEVTHPFGTDYATRVEYGNGVWIMCGPNGKISRSLDNGATWSTAATPLGTNHLYGLRYGNGRWVITGASGLLATSDDDGVTWTQRTSNTANVLYSVAWGDGSNTVTGSSGYPENGKGFWFACGAYSTILRSADGGDTWAVDTWENSGSYGNLFDICYTAGTDQTAHFVTVGDLNSGSKYNYIGYSTSWITHAYFNYNYGTNSLLWVSGRSGYYQHGLHNYDWDSNPMWNYIGIARAIMGNGYGNWSWADNLDDMPLNLMGLDGYSAKYALVGRREIAKRTPPTGGLWDDDPSEKDELWDKGRGRWMVGYSSGFLEIRNETTAYLSGIPQTKHYIPDIRAGDLLIFTAVFHSNVGDVSSLVITQKPDNTSTGIYEMVSPYFTTTPVQIISQDKTTAGDNINIVTAYCYANSDYNIAYARNYYWGTNSGSHYVTLGTASGTDLGVKATTSNVTEMAYWSVNGIVSTMSVISSATYGPYLKARATLTAGAERRYHGVGPECPGAGIEASMTVIAHVDPVAHYGGTFSYNYTEVSGTTLALNYTGTIPAGSLIVMYASMDNASASTPVITVSDNAGNTWTTNVQRFQGTSAAAGLTTAIASTTTSANRTGTLTLTVTASVAVKCRIVGARWFTGVGPSYAAATNANSASGTAATVTLAGINSGDLVVGAVGWENDVAATLEGDTTNGSWINIINGATGSGGNAATHIRLAAHYKITTGAGSQTYDATTPSTDWASVIAAWRTPKAVSLYNFLYASMTVEASVLQAKRATATLNSSAAIEVTEEYIPATGEVVVARTDADIIAIASVAFNLSSSLNAELFYTAEANVPSTHTATVSLNAVTTTTSTAITPKTYSAEASLAATARLRAGYTYAIDVVPMLATASFDMSNSMMPNPGDGTFVESPTDENEPPQSIDYGHSAGYGFGDLIEITDRTYQKRYQTGTLTSTWPGIPSRYSCGAVGGQSIHLGANKVLTVHVQENYSFKKLNTTPPIVVATLLDCNGRDPVVITQIHHELPVSARSWRNKIGAELIEMEPGSFYYHVSGWTRDDSIYPPLDEGSMDNFNDKHSSFSIAARLEVADDIVAFEWVKLWGSLYGSAGGYSQYVGHAKSIAAIHQGDIIMSLTYTGVLARLVRVNFTTGEWMEEGPAYYCGTFPDWWCMSQYIYSGDDLYDLGFHGYTGQTLYRKINLSTLTADPGFYHGLEYNGIPVAPGIFRTFYSPKRPIEGENAFSFAFVGGVASATDKRIRTLKWYINADGIPEVTEMWSTDISVIPSDIWNWVSGQPITGEIGEPEDTHYQNYAIMEDDLRPSTDEDEYDTWGWFDRYMSADWSNWNWFWATHRNDDFTYIFHSTELGTGDQYPMRSTGTHIVHKLDTEDMDGRAAAWYSNPIDNSTWYERFPIRDDEYWSTYNPAGFAANPKYYQKYSGYKFLAQTNGCMLDNGNALVFLSGTNHSHADQYLNGEYRAFATIVVIGDPPPLKMTQRDDDKRDGAARIGYIPVNGDSQRISSQTY